VNVAQGLELDAGVRGVEVGGDLLAEAVLGDEGLDAKETDADGHDQQKLKSRVTRRSSRNIFINKASSFGILPL
jgi:hypothetical protein